MVPRAGMRAGGVNYQLTGVQERPVRQEQPDRSVSSGRGSDTSPRASLFDIDWSEVAAMEADEDVGLNDRPQGRRREPEAWLRPADQHTHVREGQQRPNNDLDDLVTQRPPENCKGGKDLGGRPPKSEDGSDDEGGGGLAELTSLVNKLAVT